MSLFCFILLNLWRVVPLIILITSTSTPATVSAVSIAAVSIGSSNGSLGDTASVYFAGKMQPNYNLSGYLQQPNGVPFQKGNDTKRNLEMIGALPLPVMVGYKLDQRENNAEEEMTEEGNLNRHHERVRMGDIRVMSNQDVATLALAVDNSSSVAVANINSSYNTLSVTIGTSSYPGTYNKYDSGSRFNPYYDRNH